MKLVANCLLLLACTATVAPSRSDAAAPQRPACGQYYPVPNDALFWTHCSIAGNSACGGPPQCACQADERLITFKCDQGYYHSCEAYNPDSNGNLTRWCK